MLKDPIAQIDLKEHMALERMHALETFERMGSFTPGDKFKLALTYFELGELNDLNSQRFSGERTKDTKETAKNFYNDAKTEMEELLEECRNSPTFIKQYKKLMEYLGKEPGERLIKQDKSSVNGYEIERTVGDVLNQSRELEERLDLKKEVKKYNLQRRKEKIFSAIKKGIFWGLWVASQPDQDELDMENEKPGEYKDETVKVVLTSEEDVEGFQESERALNYLEQAERETEDPTEKVFIAFLKDMYALKGKANYDQMAIEEEVTFDKKTVGSKAGRQIFYFQNILTRYMIGEGFFSELDKLGKGYLLASKDYNVADAYDILRKKIPGLQEIDRIGIPKLANTFAELRADKLTYREAKLEMEALVDKVAGEEYKTEKGVLAGVSKVIRGITAFVDKSKLLAGAIDDKVEGKI